MKQVASITIARPQSEVWKLVGDPSQWPRWSRDFELVELHGPLQDGTRIDYKYRGRLVEATITPYVEGKSYGVHAVEGAYIFNESITLQGRDGGTVVTFAMEFQPTAFWARAAAVLIWPVKWFLLGRPLQQSLRRIRAAAETV